MRVLLEGWRLARTRDTGGVDVYWRNLVRALLTHSAPEDRFVLLSAFVNPARSPAIEALRRRGAAVRHHWVPPQGIQALGRLGCPAEWFAGGHDLVHASEPWWPLRGRGRLVVTAHDLMYRHHPQFLAPEWAARLERGTRELAPRADFWICDSAFTRAELLREYGIPPGRTAVVHVGVEDRFREVASDEEAPARARADFGLGARPWFLFLGSVEPKKNLPTLLAAFARTLAAGSESQLVVAGRAGWKSEELRRVVDEHPALRDRVRFLGFVDDASLPALVAGARALVLPSWWEGFGIPVVEAMAAGTPVLCSDRGSLPEVAGGAARLFHPGDEEGLAALLAEIEADDAEHARLRAAGLARAAAFTWERCARQTLAAYRRALELPR